MNMNKNRYEKPVQTPSRGAEVKKRDCVTIEQKMKTTAAEVCWNSADKAEPSRYQETAVATEGAGTGGTTNVRSRSTDCNKRGRPFRHCQQTIAGLRNRCPPGCRRLRLRRLTQMVRE